MRRIFKYQISPDLDERTNVVQIPKGSKFLTLGCQRNRLFAWYEVPSENAGDLEPRVFYIVYTGGIVPLPSSEGGNMKYRGTVIEHFVCHVYEGLGK